MTIYHDLLRLKGQGLKLGKLKLSTASDLTKLSVIYGSLPSDYLDFLSSIGYGQIGSSQYMIYGGPMEPAEIYGNESPRLSNILLFGDDFQGFNAGFKADDNWSVIEIDPLDFRINVVAPDFQTFIRRKISQIQPE